MVEQGLLEAISCWKKALGEEKVITDPSLLKGHLSNISEFNPRSVPAILVPRSRAQLIQIVEIANRFKAPIHPVSTGKNWGLGSMLPVQDHCSIVLSSELNSIIEVNSKLRYAIIEPGVTQRQLADHLNRLDRSVTFNFTGAGTDTSILGNILERGTGFQGQRTQNLLALEVILGNQQIVRTGFSHLYGSLAESKPFYAHGAGPDLNQLFTQSNYGIVTSAAIALVPKRRYVLAELRIPESKLKEALDLCLELKDKSIIHDGPLFMNEEDPRFSFLGADKSGLKSQNKWMVMTRLAGLDAIIAEQRKELIRRLSSLGGPLEFYDAADSDARSGYPKSIITILDILDGQPTNFNLEAMARLNPAFNSPRIDVDGDRSIPGFVCVLPVVPLTGEALMSVIQLSMDVSKRFDVKPGISFTPMNAFVMEGFIRLYFDRTNPSEVKRAHDWSKQLNEQVGSLGFHPYRLSIEQMREFHQRIDGGYSQTISGIKRLLDPNSIISPGRYVP